MPSTMQSSTALSKSRASSASSSRTRKKSASSARQLASLDKIMADHKRAVQRGWRNTQPLTNIVEVLPSLDDSSARIKALTSPDQAKLLLLINLYSSQEICIREIPLMVLVFEAALNGIFFFDYAPCPVVFSKDGITRRIWMNVSQEGRSTLAELIQMGFIDKVVMLTDDDQPSRALQVSPLGVKAVEWIPRDFHREVESFAKYRGVLQYIDLADDDIFWMYTRGGPARISSVTDLEDVSYVTSPYLPTTLTLGNHMNNNSARAHESGKGVSDMKKEQNEILHVSYLNILLVDWVPMGTNLVRYLEDHLGVKDRCKAPVRCALAASNPTCSRFTLPAGLTQLKLVRNENGKSVTAEAEIHYPEQPEVIQIEHFGVHIDYLGSVVCGLKIEAIQDRMGERVSLDQVSRLSLDINQDCSRLTANMLVSHQRVILDVLYRGKTESRPKITIGIADDILPHESDPTTFAVKPELANEISQVFGDVLRGGAIDTDTCMIVCSNGLLVFGPKAHDLEEILITYAILMAREKIIETVVNRFSQVNVALQKARKLIANIGSNPFNEELVRAIIDDSQREADMLLMALNHATQDIKHIPLNEHRFAKNLELAAKFYKLLSPQSVMKQTLMQRARFFRPQLKMLLTECDFVSKMLCTVARNKLVSTTAQCSKLMHDISTGGTSKKIVHWAVERAVALKNLIIIWIGLCSLKLMDALCISSSNRLTIRLTEMAQSAPFSWTMAMVFIALLGLPIVILFGKYFWQKAYNTVTTSYILNAQTEMHLLKLLLAKKKAAWNTIQSRDLVLTLVKWHEVSAAWRGPPPLIEMQIDFKNRVIRTVSFEIADLGPLTISGDYMLEQLKKQLPPLVYLNEMSKSKSWTHSLPSDKHLALEILYAYKRLTKEQRIM